MVASAPWECNVRVRIPYSPSEIQVENSRSSSSGFGAIQTESGFDGDTRRRGFESSYLYEYGVTGVTVA